MKPLRSEGTLPSQRLPAQGPSIWQDLRVIPDELKGTRMKDQDKSKEELVNALIGMRQKTTS